MGTLVSRDEMDAWREAHPEAALAEAISVSVGCILTYEPDEARRKAAIEVLIECHRRALAGFEPERRLH
jgi:hypothetical protein